MLLSSVQRRRQVVGASGRRIVTYDETPDERAWFVPPYFRKTRKGGSRSHLVPVLGFGATAIDALAKRVDEDGREWLFPTREANSDKPADERASSTNGSAQCLELIAARTAVAMHSLPTVRATWVSRAARQKSFWGSYRGGRAGRRHRTLLFGRPRGRPQAADDGKMDRLA